MNIRRNNFPRTKKLKMVTRAYLIYGIYLTNIIYVKVF